MCLIITHVPATRRDGLVVPAVKWMWHGYSGWRTGVMSCQIPQNGWLLPHAVSSRKNFHEGARVDVRFIHGYCECKSNVKSGLHEAFALCVEAYQDASEWTTHQELACRAMYIPDADLTDATEATIATLNEIKSPVGLVKAFPFLKKYIRSWLPKNYR